MSRWIDADAYITAMLYDDEHEEFKDERMTIAENLDSYTIEGCPPSIDIVRCGECKKRKKNSFCLEHMRYEKDDKGYCSYGEREGE